MVVASVPPAGKGPTVKGSAGDVETATAAVLPSMGSAIVQVAPGVIPSMVNGRRRRRPGRDVERRRRAVAGGGDLGSGRAGRRRRP